MAVLLGIDTGGTYTDAVLFDPETGVLASAKALTRRYDLTIGIEQAVERVLEGQAGLEIELVSLSTTLATNAVVEGQGSPICLLLIGHPNDALEQCGLGRAIGTDPVVFVRGGHDAAGEEVDELDLGAARQAIEAHAGRVAAFAVSGYFSVRNPSHENQVRALVRELSGLPVTCGHELTANLHASRRALTAALNARLVPVLERLIEAVQRMMASRGIEAPLMVVKGDGSLVSAGFALEYPIETILSGPAASVVGSLYLSEERDGCVVDMGGTTTDIALVEGGRPILNREGATVGGWHTMVEAVQIYTFGLGGDSETRVSAAEGLSVGPRRHVPLSLLGAEHPAVIEELRRQARRRKPAVSDAQFLVVQRGPAEHGGGLSTMQQAILARIGAGPVARERIYDKNESAFLVDLELGRLVDQGYVAVAGFTPTDAAHVLGHQSSWSREAAAAGAELAARLYRAELHSGPVPVEEFCRRVEAQVILQSARSVVAATLAEAHGIELEEYEVLRRIFVDRALRPEEEPGGLFDVRLALRRPLVAIGAPVGTYYPGVADSIHTRLCIPPYADVANAIGAVVGSVTQRVHVLVSPQEAGEVFRVHLEEGVQDFEGLEQACSFAVEHARRVAYERAERAGALDIHVQADRNDRTAIAGGDEFFLESRIEAVAVGRPRLAHGNPDEQAGR
ncbi:MAG: hydantoinase/oxoprolinase family protein [Spirochaetales bacterium]|nr:hydantoinase/oxoprolinase family protein [Spirochaetales bacterium]